MKNPFLFWFSVGLLMLGGAITYWAVETPPTGDDKLIRVFGVATLVAGAGGFAWLLVLAMIRSVIGAARDARND